MITSDKKRVTIDNYALWRISDPRQETMGGSLVRERGRLDDVVYSNLRDVLAKQTLEDIIKREQMHEVTRIAFYRFWRTLESHKVTLKEGDTIVLSTDWSV